MRRKKPSNMLIPVYMKSNISLKDVAELTGINKKKLSGDAFMEDQEFILCIVKRGYVPPEKRTEVSDLTVWYRTSHLQKLETHDSYWIKTEPIPKEEPINLVRKKTVPIWEKNLLTIVEASAYFRIGENEVRNATKQKGCDFCIWIGSQPFIKRKKMEQFIERTFELDKTGSRK